MSLVPNLASAGHATPQMIAQLLQRAARGDMQAFRALAQIKKAHDLQAQAGAAQAAQAPTPPSVLEQTAAGAEAPAGGLGAYASGGEVQHFDEGGWNPDEHSDLANWWNRVQTNTAASDAQQKARDDYYAQQRAVLASDVAPPEPSVVDKIFGKSKDTRAKQEAYDAYWNSKENRAYDANEARRSAPEAVGGAPADSMESQGPAPAPAGRPIVPPSGLPAAAKARKANAAVSTGAPAVPSATVAPDWITGGDASVLGSSESSSTSAPTVGSSGSLSPQAQALLDEVNRHSGVRQAYATQMLQQMQPKSMKEQPWWVQLQAMSAALGAGVPGNYAPSALQQLSNAGSIYAKQYADQQAARGAYDKASMQTGIDLSKDQLDVAQSAFNIRDKDEKNTRANNKEDRADSQLEETVRKNKANEALQREKTQRMGELAAMKIKYNQQMRSAASVKGLLDGNTLMRSLAGMQKEMRANGMSQDLIDNAKAELLQDAAAIQQSMYMHRGATMPRPSAGAAPGGNPALTFKPN